MPYRNFRCYTGVIKKELAMMKRIPKAWLLRIKVWNKFLIFKFKGNKPEDIPLPKTEQAKIKCVPLNVNYPDLHIQNVKVADHVPDDESSFFKHSVVGGQLFFNDLSSQMEAGLAQIDANPNLALDFAYTSEHKKVFPRPRLAEELAHNKLTDVLAALATSGPFAAYLEKVGDDEFQWDLLKLNQFEHHSGLKKIGVKVNFRTSNEQPSPYPHSIETDSGVFSSNSPEWDDAVKRALCAASTHTSLVRHFNGLHLSCGAHIAIVTRNELAANHPVKRLIWLSMFGSQYSNDIVMMPQMGEDGDFVNIFSFTHNGISHLFDETYADYQITSLNPKRDMQRRGLDSVEFDLPTYKNLLDLFSIFHAYTQKYINNYYVDDAAVINDSQLSTWFDGLEASIPNGIKAITDGQKTRASLAELCASFMYLGAVDHELLGTNLWNYQLWTHKIPCRCYTDDRRAPIDVYQRLVNANFNLHVSRVQLMHDYSYLALDDVGKALFSEFQSNLKKLNDEMRALPKTCAQIYPDILEANMNA